jgi:DeoR/GlpR family transcriptional regulator of sugar metabolism
MTVEIESPLIPDQRREEIMRLLRRDSVLSVHQLVDMLGVSHMTVRRDIALLEREGRAVSIPGGVRLASTMRIQPAFSLKISAEREEKVAIAACAEKLLSDGMVVSLDAGTTVGAIVPALRARSGITAVTNDFVIVDDLMDCPHVEVIHVGGRLDHPNRSSMGRFAAETLRKINTDLAFISASSWDIVRGVTTPTEAKVEPKLAAIDSAVHRVLVATSSKLGSFGMYDVVPLDAFDRIVTDWHLPSAAADGIRALGVTLETAEPAPPGR